MNSILPSISVIIPTYNRKLFLERTIQSVLNQTVAPVEIIVVDDGSTDGTKQFIKEHFEGKVRYLYQPNRERGAARNFGASVAQGDYVYFLDSDDILYPDHIAAAQEFIQANNKPEWFFQEYELQLGSKKKKIFYDRNNPIKTLLTVGNFMSCHGVFIRSDIFRKNKFNESRILAGSEDYELWIRLASKFKLKINPVVTSALMEHEGRSVLNYKVSHLIERKKKMLSLLLENESVQSRFQNHFSALQAQTFSYIALHAAMISEKKDAIKYLFQALKKNPRSLKDKRTVAILKYLLLR